MGLLDNILGASWDDPRTMAVLNLAAGLQGGRTMSQGLTQGLQGYGSTLQQAKQMQQQQEMQALQKQLLGAQINETNAQASERSQKAAMQQAQAAEQQRVRDMVQKAFNPVQPIDANAASGVAGPRPEALGAVGRTQPNWQQLIASGVPADLVKQLAEAPNLGRATVARTIDTVGPDGKPVTKQFDQFGNEIGAAQRQWKAPVVHNFGGTTGLLDPTTGELVNSYKNTASPDAVMSNALGYANLRETQRHNGATETQSRTQVINDPIRGPMIINTGSGLVRPGVGLDGKPVEGESTVKQRFASSKVLPVISEAKKLIDDATGSYVGAGVDQVARAFGVGTSGAQAGARLKALEGSIMMAQPRMEGPQSDKDVMLYRQMAGQIGDPTVPASVKKAAIDTIYSLHSKYAGQGQQMPQMPSNDFGGFKILGSK